LSTLFSKHKLVLKSNTFCPPASPNSISTRIQTHFVHLLVQRRHSTRVLCGFSLFVFDGIPAIEYSSMYVGLAWTICLVISLARVPYTHWFGQNMAAIHNVYTVFLAGKLPNIRSYTVYIHMVLANPTSVHWCRHVCGKGVRCQEEAVVHNGAVPAMEQLGTPWISSLRGMNDLGRKKKRE
jgi:hypothetical protein